MADLIRPVTRPSTSPTLMDADSKKVLNFTQVQVGQDSQVKTSPQMEKVGFVQCLREVRSKGLEVSSVTTDRQPGIRKYIREEEPGLKHGLDSWHVVDSVAMSEGNVALRISMWKNYVQQLLEEAMEEICSESYQSMKEQKTDPGPPPMTAAYTRLPKEALVSRRMLRFKS
ncbi:hypothetical protein MTO96_030335 [Rhipicephalus appendiculatus]